jgi:hypothetical protein
MEMTKALKTLSPFLMRSTMWWKCATPKKRGLMMTAWDRGLNGR